MLSLRIFLVGIFLFNIFATNGCSQQKNASVPDFLSILVPTIEEETGALFWNMAKWFIENGDFELSDQKILLEPDPKKLSPISWDGAVNFFNALPYAHDRSLVLDESIFSMIHAPYNASRLIVYQSFGPNEQILVFLPTYSERKNECIVEFFGKQPRKLTLNPTFEQYPQLRILSPLAIAKNLDRYTFYFKTFQSRSDGSIFGIAEATYDGNEVKWRIVNLDLGKIGFNAQSSFVLYRNTFYIANTDGSIWKINSLNNKISKDEKLSQLLQDFAEMHPSFLLNRKAPEFYHCGQLCVLRWHSVEAYDMSMTMEEASIILVFNQSQVFLQHQNNESQDKPEGFSDPILWVFPQCIP